MAVVLSRSDRIARWRTVRRRYVLSRPLSDRQRYHFLRHPSVVPSNQCVVKRIVLGLRSSAEMKISVQLKDAMRETCIEVIVDAWYKLVVLYCQKDAELTTLVLHTLQKYISWMSVGLVVNNQSSSFAFSFEKGVLDLCRCCLNC